MQDSVTLVDVNDNVLGPISKVEAHLRTNLDKSLSPHRAFSLFLFNSKNELLLQQRSDKKVTFPSLWTNSCCSHPRHIPSELESSIDNNYLGLKRAAVRRSGFELGIEEDLLGSE
jgi:isopentenyl-diphosphate Delta-isomerase